MCNQGESFRTIWQKPDNAAVVQVIDQRRLPHEYVIQDLTTWRDGADAIRDMLVRGAPLIGATAAWSLYLAALESRASADSAAFIARAAEALGKTRPTAVNLRWALDRVIGVVNHAGESANLVALLEKEARNICEEDIEISRALDGTDYR